MSEARSPVSRRTARPGPHGRRLRQGGDGARGGRARADHDVARRAAADPRRRDEEGRSAADGAARRHHGGQADGRADSALPSADSVARRRHARRRCATATRIEARVRTTDRTGVEMEALTAVAVAALTIYDMVKAVDRAMVIGDIRLVEKRGGRSGEYRGRDDPRLDPQSVRRCGTFRRQYRRAPPPRFPGAHVPPRPNDDEALATRSPTPTSSFAGQITRAQLSPRRPGCGGFTARRRASAACCSRRWSAARSSSRTRAGCRPDTIAEHVIAVTLALFRRLPHASRSQAAREWAQDAIGAGAIDDRGRARARRRPRRDWRRGRAAHDAARRAGHRHAPHARPASRRRRVDGRAGRAPARAAAGGRRRRHRGAAHAARRAGSSAAPSSR